MKKREECARSLDLRVLAFLLLALTLLFIWGNSIRHADASHTQSSMAQELFRQIFDITKEPFRFLYMNLRKVAHFLEFMLLGGEVIFLFFLYRRGGARDAALGLGFCAAAAIVDEGIQYFVPGRTAAWQDVLLDTVGAACGMLTIGILLLLLLRLFKKK